MNKRRVGLSVLGSVLAVATPAAAADPPRVGGDMRLAESRPSGRQGRHESPQNFAVELRFGPYFPDIDSDPALGGKKPFANVFGDSNRVLAALEVDWQLLRIPHLGTVGPALAAGITSMSAQAALSAPGANGARVLSAEETGISIYPFWAAAVLRADVLSRELRIPLVPYLKAGLSYALWRTYNGSGTSSVGGVTGKGVSYGTLLAAGLAFDLNVLDEYTARNFDSTFGVNHTYLFGEVYDLNLSSFGSANALRVGATTWAMGLTFEF